MTEVRRYPAGCLSAFCGRTECPEDCERLPLLREFKEWVARTDARVADPIWSPNVYVADGPDNEGKEGD